MDTNDSFFIPGSYSRIVARELHLQEKSLATLLRGTGLADTVLLPGDETHLTGGQQLQVLKNARLMANDPEFGLRLGRRLQPSSHGPLGYLVLSSPDLLTSLQSLRDFLPTRLPFVQLELSTGPEWIVCTLQPRLAAAPDEWRTMQECFAMVIQSVAESVLGREVGEAHIAMEHSAPAYQAQYANYLHAPVHFSQASSEYRLPATLGHVTNVISDAAAYALAQDLCVSLLTQVPGKALSNADRVRRLLLSQPGGKVTEVDIAQAMYVSKRTLARRLEQEGTSYREIREIVFSELAAQHLRESNLPVESVSALLGYSDTSAFRKAFRRWFGQSPSQFRSSARSAVTTGPDLAS